MEFIFAVFFYSELKNTGNIFVFKVPTEDGKKKYHTSLDGTTKEAVDEAISNYQDFSLLSFLSPCGS